MSRKILHFSLGIYLFKVNINGNRLNYRNASSVSFTTVAVTVVQSFGIFLIRCSFVNSLRNRSDFSDFGKYNAIILKLQEMKSEHSFYHINKSVKSSQAKIFQQMSRFFALYRRKKETRNIMFISISVYIKLFYSTIKHTITANYDVGPANLILLLRGLLKYSASHAFFGSIFIK